MSKTLALFDFDGTISTRDSFLHFLMHAKGPFRLLIGLPAVLPTLTLFALKVIPNWQAKERVLRHFFKGITKETLESLGTIYAQQAIGTIIKNSALETLNWHKSQGHRVILVSASVDIWLKQWASDMGIELICSTLEYKNNRATGKLSGVNCWGPEKVRRIKNHLNLDDYELIYAYGDTRGDREMLQIASKPFYREFK